MYIYNKWNKDFYEKHDEWNAYKKRKDTTKANTDVEALTQNFQNLKDLTPLEMDELVVSAAELDVTPQQYYELYKTTKPIQVNIQNGKPSEVLNFLKKVQTTHRNNKKIFDNTKSNLGFDKGEKFFTQTAFMTLNSVFDLLQRGAVNGLALPYFAIEEEILAEQGMTRQDLIEFEKKGRNDNQQEWKAAGIRAKALLFTLSKGIASVPETILNAVGLDTPYESIPDLKAQSQAWLTSQGMVDADGEPYLQKTDIGAAIDITKDKLIEEIQIQERSLKRDLTETEKISMALSTWYEVVTEEVDSSNSFLNTFSEATPIAENRKLREGYERGQVSSNLGDFASYLVTGNMPGRYSPQNVIYEDTQLKYDLKILQAEQAFDLGEISIEQKNTLVDELEDERDEELTKISFEPNKGLSGIMGGAMNLAAMYYTDPVVMFAKGVGLAGKVPDKFDEVLAGAQKEMKRFVDDGGSVAEFWQNNDDILDGLSRVIVEGNKAGQPTFLNLINSGFNHKFAKTLADANDPAVIKDGLIDGFNNQYVSDMVFGKESLGRTGQFRIQAKVLSDNLFKAFGDKELDDSIQAVSRRGGTFKELINGTDVRLANMGEVDLRNAQQAVVIFARVGNLFKVPESRLNKLLIDFYDSIDEGLYTKAQEIYFDGLVRTEGGLQLRYLYGLSDNEIDLVLGEALKKEKRMFSDEVGDFLTPSRTDEFYPVDEIDILTQKQFGGQVEGLDVPQEFIRNSIELINQFKGFTIEVPEVMQIIKTTSQRRRLRAQALIEKEGIDKVFDKARKAFDEGKPGTFWDENTPMGAEIASIAKGLGDPGDLFKTQEVVLSAIEKGVFGIVRSAFYPLQLLGRFAYPAKLTIDGHLRASLLGVRSAFRSPLKFVRFLFNDAQGAVARAVGYKPDTSLVGPYKITRKLEFKNPKLQGLNEKIPASIRKALGVLQDSADYGIPELNSLSSASPTFAFGRRTPDTGYDLINKVGTRNVPTPEGEVIDFQLADEYIEAMQEYLFEYVDDDLAVITAALMKQGLDYTDIAKFYQETPAVQNIIEQANKMMQSRNVFAKGIMPIVTKEEDYLKLAKHYYQSINNISGGDQALKDIIATGKVGNIDLRSPDSMTPDNLGVYNARIKKLVNKNRQNLPDQVPKARPELDERKGYQRALDALFFATAQVESDLIRVPLFKQAYEHFVGAGLPFTSKTGLNRIMNAHLDPESSVKLSDDLFKQVQKEYDAIKDLAPDIAVTERTVPIKVYDNGDSLSVIAYSPEGQKSIASLKRIDSLNDQLTFDLNIYNTELKVFGKQSAVADYRLGDDGSKIGVYNFSVNKSEAIIDGAIPNRDALVNAISNNLDESVNAEALVDEALEYLAGSKGKFDLPITRKDLYDILGISGREYNLSGLQKKLQKGKLSKSGDVGPSTLNRVIGPKKSRPILRGKKETEEAIDNAFEYTSANPEGFSIDLGTKTNYHQPGYYVSPYPSKSLVKTGTLTKKEINDFIIKNKTLLKKEDHFLGGWVDGDVIHLDVTIKVKKGVAAQVVDGTDEALAKAQYLGIIGKQAEIGNVSTAGYQGSIGTQQASGAYDVIRRAGQDLLIGSQKKILPSSKAITNAATSAKVIGNDVLESAGIKAIVDQKAGVVQILKPQTNPILGQRTFSGDYQSMLDLSDIKSATTPRVMSFEDLHERGVEYAFELHSRLLYNLTERGFFSQAYRVGFAFFEAWREVLGRYYNLGLANPKAVGQIGFGYRKGIEHNFIYEDSAGEKYLIVPVGGTPFEDYVKTEGRGAFTDDMAISDSKIIAKRGIPLSALNVGGGGLFPPVGPAIALPVGMLVKDKPKAKKNLEKYIFGGFELSGANYDSIGDLPRIILLDTLIPSVGKQMLNNAATNLGTPGLDEDQWLSSIDSAYQHAAILRPDLADDVVALEEVAMVLAANYFQLKAWDRFVNPFIPRLSVLYAIEGNEVAFREWYGENGEDTGLVYNNFVELSVIHGFYQDIKDEYVMTLGQQGEFYALLEVAKLLGLDQRDLSEGFTSVALQVKGKNVSEGGRLPRTTPEYNFVLDNPELADEFGPVLVYFAPGLDEGATEYGGVSYISNLGLFKPKTPNEFYLSTQTFLASAIESASKDYWSTVIDNSTVDPGERIARKKAKFALIESDLSKMFPMAYGNSAELNKVLGSDYETGVPNNVLIDYLERAVNDPRFANFDNKKEIQLYLNYRAQAIDAVADSKGYPIEEDAMRWISTNASIQAQEVRNQLFTKAQEIGRNNPKFLVIFEEIFSYELTKFGLEE